jgi:hypothetical protein
MLGRRRRGRKRCWRLVEEDSESEGDGEMGLLVDVGEAGQAGGVEQG